MKRSYWLLVSMFAYVLCFGVDPGRPNFIIVIGDDISQEDFGCYGHPYIHTPNVDKLAEDGIRFDAAFLTASSCSPSRNSILSGMYPHNTRAQHLHLPLPGDTVTIPKLFQEAGYHTVSAGKYHSGPFIQSHFDTLKQGGQSGSEDWLVVLRDRPRDKPFFMWLASIDAHRGWSAQDIPNPHTVNDVLVPPFLLDSPEIREDFVQYYNEIARLDSNLGRVREELEKQGVADNTFILFMADNGRPYPRSKNSNYDSGMETPFVVYYPPITDRNRGKSTMSLVSAVDIAPTLMDIAGIPAPDSFQGESFRPVMEDPKQVVRDRVFSEKNWHDFAAHERSVRTSDYLYIRNSFPEWELVPAADCWKGGYPEILERYHAGTLPEGFDWVGTGRPAELLFEVKKDPQQMLNLSGNPEYAQVLVDMRTKLDQWIRQTHDVVPENPVPDFFSRKDNSKLYPGQQPNQHAARYFADVAEN